MDNFDGKDDVEWQNTPSVPRAHELYTTALQGGETKRHILDPGVAQQQCGQTGRIFQGKIIGLENQSPQITVKCVKDHVMVPRRQLRVAKG